jgi:hypothetical protein
VPPETNKPGVTGGVTEACLFNDHSMCTNPRCQCTCHASPTKAEASQQINQPTETGPEKSCPTCGSKRPFNETFCRIDGSRLSSLACNICGRDREPADLFCFNCGSPANAEAKPELARVVNIPTVPSVEPEISYVESVLKGLQEELNVQQPTQSVENTVVEQPGGSQGSFKLVSRANPNKVRLPAGGNVPRENASPVAPRQRKLPVKPS